MLVGFLGMPRVKNTAKKPYFWWSNKKGYKGDKRAKFLICLALLRSQKGDFLGTTWLPLSLYLGRHRCFNCSTWVWQSMQRITPPRRWRTVGIGSSQSMQCVADSVLNFWARARLCVIVCSTMMLAWSMMSGMMGFLVCLFLVGGFFKNPAFKRR